MVRTVRYRLRSNNRKKYNKLESTAGCCRFIWNQFVDIFKPDDFTGDFSHSELGNQLRGIKSIDRYKWLGDVSAYILQHSLLDFSLACNRYKNPKIQANKPNKKTKFGSDPSFPVNSCSVSLKDKWINIYKVGWFRLTGKNPYPDGKFLSGRIKKECGKWYAYLVYEIEDKKEEAKELQVVAIDRNSRQITCSDGSVFKLPDVSPQESRKLWYERKLARQVKFSNRWKKTKLILQRIHKKIYNIYQNWRHHVSKKLSGLYNQVVLEKLDIKSMTSKDKTDNKLSKVMSKKKLKTMNKNILATSWFKLEQYLRYKGCEIYDADPKYTSQSCSRCNYISSDNRKGSKFNCLNCGYELNSDLNASFNLLNIFYVNKLASGNGVAGQVNCQREVGFVNLTI